MDRLLISRKERDELIGSRVAGMLFACHGRIPFKIQEPKAITGARSNRQAAYLAHDGATHNR
jgi:hypothetical protein